MEYNRPVGQKPLSGSDDQSFKLHVSTATDKLEPTLRRFAARLKRDFGDQISRDPAAFKKQILRLIRRELPPRRGRPVSPQVEAALAMVRQGKSVPEVLRAQVSGFEKLDTYGRYLMEKALRQAMARRRRHRNPQH